MKKEIGIGLLKMISSWLLWVDVAEMECTVFHLVHCWGDIGLWGYLHWMAYDGLQMALRIIVSLYY
jgi:hypothetical protein